jgi:hypothetical protein
MKKEPVSASTFMAALAAARLRQACRSEERTAAKKVEGSVLEEAITQLQSFFVSLVPASYCNLGASAAVSITPVA